VPLRRSKSQRAKLAVSPFQTLAPKRFSPRVWHCENARENGARIWQAKGGGAFDGFSGKAHRRP
jgi:hypothetical protein